MFKSIHGKPIFEPHEMKWTINDFMDNAIDVVSKEDSRLRKRIDKSFNDKMQLI